MAGANRIRIEDLSVRRFPLTALCFMAFCAFAFTAAAEPTDAGGNPADEAFAGAMRDMMAGMHKAPPTGDPDTDFVAMMLPHHQGAVDMAKAELQYGKDDGLKAMAKEIVTAQEKEIAMMKAWEDRKRHGH